MDPEDRSSALAAPGHAPVTVPFRSVCEDAPGAAWPRVFWSGWPGWSSWLGDRAGGPADLDRAVRALRRFMPELVPVWERLVLVAGADARAARFLTFWSPPRYILHCSQAAVVDADGPALLRNYDLDPALNEGFLYRTAWLGRPVMGMADGLAGLADGVNAAGLAVSLAFGGRPEIGPGFGVPLILRYLLEVCRDTPDAIEAVRRLPCHMSYNLTLIDRAGRHGAVLLAPDRPAIVTAARHATNHQLGVEWPRHGRDSRTLEREAYLAQAVGDGRADADQLRRRFLAPPLHSRRYGAGFGTIYTALYRPAQGSVEISWPGIEPIRQRLDAFAPGTRRITFTDDRDPREAAPDGRALPAAPQERNPAP
ncbi:C45 family autoproteolytic acyltransferase/hydolase [Amaricoccus sp.]|uniref:C45 family autoproteolytic acyltransferase/hydolase n=1 Tax=Amaricoccus sp. TaxID=1872485 RepID=UPI001B7890DE|nr:C45 family peptidase [Amaricoccus sp.]MBP7003589.1 hypothetical protein [Amaricoccus sp.]